jgi:hypothetical protein
MSRPLLARWCLIDEPPHLFEADVQADEFVELPTKAGRVVVMI